MPSQRPRSLQVGSLLAQRNRPVPPSAEPSDRFRWRRPSSNYQRQSLLRHRRLTGRAPLGAARRRRKARAERPRLRRLRLRLRLQNLQQLEAVRVMFVEERVELLAKGRSGNDKGLTFFKEPLPDAIVYDFNSVSSALLFGGINQITISILLRSDDISSIF